MTLASAPMPARLNTLGRWLQLLLVASLAVNLLIAGAIMGGAWVLRDRHEFERRGPPGPPVEHNAGPIGKFIASLPPERKQALHDVIAQYHNASAEFNKGMAAVRREAGQALTTDPFDQAKFEAALKRVYDAEVTGRMAMIPATGTVVEKLSEAERKEFLRLLRWQRGASADNPNPEPPADAKAP